jgi:hypothetical protein
MSRLRLLLAAAALAVLATSASAAPITEIEGNNTIATAQSIPGSAFTLPVPATVFNPPGYATATVSGTGGGGDVDIYAFTATGGEVFFDIDDNPFTFDTLLSFFDSTGTLIGYNDDSGPVDPGSQFANDSFLGVLPLPSGLGTYYIAVSAFPNIPVALLGGGLTSTSVVRPDGAFGGFSLTGFAPGSSTFSQNGNATGLPYTLHISVQSQTTTVPEPTTLLLVGAGLLTVAARRHRPRR